MALAHMANRVVVGLLPLSGSDRPMPHKHNAERRHHIPKMSFKVLNWPKYEAGCTDVAVSPCGSRTQRWTTGKPSDRKARPAMPTPPFRQC